MLSVCAGLVTIDDGSSIIRLVHYTAQEYFQQTLPSWIPTAQEKIARVCLEYLCFDVFELGPLESGYTTDRLRDNALLSYAATYWSAHFRQAKDTSLERTVLDFFEQAPKLKCAIQVFHKNESLDLDTKIHAAAMFGLADIGAIFLARDHPPDVKGSYDFTPLAVAALGGESEVVELLADRDDVDRNSLNEWYTTPLSLAAEEGHEAVVKVLLRYADVKVNAGNFRGQSAISLAARRGHEAIVQLMLLQDNVYAGAKDQDDLTALHHSAGEGHEEIVQCLLRRDDVEADSKDTSGRTPLCFAAMGGNPRIIELLIQRHDVEIDSTANTGWSALTYAAVDGHAEVVEILAKREDVDVNRKDAHGCTIVEKAASQGHPAIVEILKRHGAQHEV